MMDRLSLSGIYVVTGWIVAVQEERFRLLSDAGQGYLLTLSRHSHARSVDLQAWYQRGTRVAVGYRGEPNVSTGVAWAVRETGPKRGR